jgi:hypothetical protein
MKETPGKRIENPIDGILPGEYGKSLQDGTWWICTPNGHFGRINDKVWKIIENEDKTITVTPSIRVSYPTADHLKGWHGYLTNGIWKEC